jgi:hypothetical protein
LTLASTAWITRQVSHSDLAALAAAGMLLLTPCFVANSRAALADLPALTLAALALAVTFHGKNTEKQVWFVAAGFLYGASLAVKPTSFFILLPIVALLWTRDGRAAFPSHSLAISARRVLFLAGGCVIGLVLFFAWVPVGAFLQQMLQSYRSAQQRHGLELVENLRRMWFYFTGKAYGGSQYGLFAVKAFGFAAMLRQRRNPKVLAILIWLGTGFLVWLTHTPLYDHHLITLLPPSVILAALGVKELRQMISAAFKPYSLSLFGICCLWLYLLSVPALGRADMTLAAPPQDKEDRQALLAAQELKNLTDIKDFIVTDSLMMACHAHRNVPPEMVNVSGMRISSGQLTAQDAIAWTREYEPTAIIFWNDRLESMPEYVHWIQAYFRLARWFGKERRIYLPLTSPAHYTMYTFEDKLTLLGYTWEPTPAEQGGNQQLTLYWRAEIQPQCNYTLQIAPLNGAAKRQEAIRMQLAKDDLSPSHWHKGDIVASSYLVPESYSENVAIALMREGHHLKVSGASGRRIPDNTVRLGNGPV